MGKLLEYVVNSAFILAKACDLNPALSTITVMLFSIMFYLVEAVIEALIFGERFQHWLDPFFMLLFIAYAALVVYACAATRELQKRYEENIDD